MIKVVIERWVSQELSPMYNQQARLMLQLAMQQPGFICGEALHDLNNPAHRYTIATFRSVRDWQYWFEHPKRIELMNNLMPMMEHEEKITLLEHAITDL